MGGVGYNDINIHFFPDINGISAIETLCRAHVTLGPRQGVLSGGNTIMPSKVNINSLLIVSFVYKEFPNINHPLIYLAFGFMLGSYIDDLNMVYLEKQQQQQQKQQKA